MTKKLKVVKTSWRPLIELHATKHIKDTDDYVDTDNIFYLNVLKVPHIISNGEGKGTTLVYEDFVVSVKESPEEIFKTVDKMVKDEADRKAAMAKEYQAASEERVAKFEKA